MKLGPKLLILPSLLPAAAALFSLGSDNSSSSLCVSGFCLPAHYERNESPPGLTEVHQKLVVMDILSVSDADSKISIYGFLGTRWIEPRMFADENETKLALGDGISVDPLLTNYLWMPDLKVLNLQSFMPLTEPKPHKALSIYNKPDGKMQILYRQGVVITFKCLMRFELYPLDSHICKLQIGSSFDPSKIKLSAMEFNLRDDLRSIILEYEADLSIIEVKEVSSPEWGKLSMNGIRMRLTRHKLKYISIYYLPSGMFVIVSWASFLIPPEVVAGRMAMLVTLFLVLINIFGVIVRALPNAGGVTAIATWMIVCIHFVFFALLEYAYLLWLLKPSLLKSKTTIVFVPAAPTDPEGGSSGSVEGNKKSRRVLMKLDDVCLVVFPIMFVMFNVCYWSICLNKSPSDEARQFLPSDTMQAFATQDD